MRKVAKLVAALMMTVSVATVATTSAEAQRRPRGEPAAAATPQVSRPFAAAFTPVNTAITASDWATADAGLPALKAASTTPYEIYVAAQTEFRIASGMRNVPRQLASVDAMIDSTGAPAADLPRLYVAGAQLAYNQEQFAKAASRLEQAIALGNASEEVALLRLDSLLRAGQIEPAIAYGNSVIAGHRAAGTVVPENLYSLLARGLQEVDREADLASLLVDRAVAYPSEFNFRTAALIYLGVVPDNRGVSIDTLRLMLAAGAANDRRYFVEHVQNLADEGLPYEAVQVITAGRAASLIPATDATFNEIANTQGDKLAEDRTSLPGLERRALAAPDARLATIAADANIGYNNNARAEELYTAALTKTGADADLINTRIGIARFNAGNFTGAIEAFERVQGAVRGPVARLWMALARSRSAPVAPAVPAAPAAPATPPAG